MREIITEQMLIDAMGKTRANEHVRIMRDLFAPEGFLNKELKDDYLEELHRSLEYDKITKALSGKRKGHSDASEYTQAEYHMLLDNFDEYYHYSDDHGVWSYGNETEKLLKAIQKIHPEWRTSKEPLTYPDSLQAVGFHGLSALDRLKIGSRHSTVMAIDEVDAFAEHITELTAGWGGERCKEWMARTKHVPSIIKCLALPEEVQLAIPKLLSNITILEKEDAFPIFGASWSRRTVTLDENNGLTYTFKVITFSVNCKHLHIAYDFLGQEPTEGC